MGMRRRERFLFWTTAAFRLFDLVAVAAFALIARSSSSFAAGGTALLILSLLAVVCGSIPRSFDSIGIMLSAFVEPWA
jgi:hypothetical protein